MPPSGNAGQGVGQVSRCSCFSDFPQRTHDIAPGNELEVLRARLVAPVLCDKQAAGELPAETAWCDFNTVGLLDTAESAIGHAESSSRFHAGQAIEREGIVALARCDQPAAATPLRKQRQTLDVGDQLPPVDQPAE